MIGQIPSYTHYEHIGVGVAPRKNFRSPIQMGGPHIYIQFLIATRVSHKIQIV